jgi:hypothetical protein
MLTSFSVENYRAFSRRQEIDIRPLTLFFGWNSSGKSALIRFLPLLAESVRVSGPPIWLSGDIGRGTTWPELVCKATERDSLRFSLRWDNTKALDVEWEIAGGLDGSWQQVRSLSISDDEEPEPSHYFVDETNDVFTGLVPSSDLVSSFDFEESALIDSLITKLNQFASQVQWISGVRVPPPRIATYGGGTSPTLRPNGLDAVNHLIAARLRSTADPLLNATQDFFSALGEQLVLDNPALGVWRVLLHPLNAQRVSVNLCDTGEGYAQALPVLIALARARLDGPRILCIEQPELHLHTRAQVELSKLLVSTANDSAKPRILIETHSEILLTGVQLAIAKGEISPDMVRVYWVESRPDGTSDAISVDFDGLGHPTNTAITGAFEEAIHLGQELIAKQMLMN